MSYGEPVTNIGKANVPMLQDDTAEAMMFAAPALARVPRAAKFAVTQAAKDFAHASAAGVPHVIKPKGGNWLAGSVENAVEPMRTYMPNPEDVRAAGMNPDTPARYSADAMNKWIDTKLAKYVKNEMATPEDPIRALAEKGITHAELAPERSYYAPDFRARRRSVDFPEEGMGVSPEARAWEFAADDVIHNLPAGDRLAISSPPTAQARLLGQNPWIAKVPPETMTYGVYGRNFEGQTQFEHLTDELRNAINPESGLPQHLLWKYQDLDKVTVPQAVQRVHDINTWRAAQKAEADALRANNAAAFTHKDYEDAPYKWVELKKPDELPEGWTKRTKQGSSQEEWLTPEGRLTEDNVDPRISSLEDALKYEGETMGHCVGRYCEDVLQGNSRIFSLRNKKTGEPHATIEVSPANDFDTTADNLYRRYENEILDHFN
jgi:hypothetical protein